MFCFCDWREIVCFAWACWVHVEIPIIYVIRRFSPRERYHADWPTLPHWAEVFRISRPSSDLPPKLKIFRILKKVEIFKIHALNRGRDRRSRTCGTGWLSTHALASSEPLSGSRTCSEHPASWGPHSHGHALPDTAGSNGPYIFFNSHVWSLFFLLNWIRDKHHSKNHALFNFQYTNGCAIHYMYWALTWAWPWHYIIIVSILKINFGNIK